MASAMDVDDEEIEAPTSSSSKGEKKRFEVKKVNVFYFNLSSISHSDFLCNLLLSVECCCPLGLG